MRCSEPSLLAVGRASVPMLFIGIASVALAGRVDELESLGGVTRDARIHHIKFAMCIDSLRLCFSRHFPSTICYAGVFSYTRRADSPDDRRQDYCHDDLLFIARLGRALLRY